MTAPRDPFSSQWVYTEDGSPPRRQRQHIAPLVCLFLVAFLLGLALGYVITRAVTQ